MWVSPWSSSRIPDNDISPGSVLACFLGPDGGPRHGAIRLLPEKPDDHPPIPEEESSPPTPVFEETEPRANVGLTKKISRRFSNFFAKRVTDAQDFSTSPTTQPSVPLMSPGTRSERTRTFSRTSRVNGSAYGYSGGYRNRRGSLGSSLRRRRGSNYTATQGSPFEGPDLNFAQRILMANENAVTNIADLWVAAAMNVDNENPFESDNEDAIDDDADADSLDLGEPLSRSQPDTELPITDRRNSIVVPNTGVPLMSRSPRTHRPSSAGSSAPQRLSNRHPSISFSPLTSPPPRRLSAVPSIFAHPGVKTPSAVLDAQQLLLANEGDSAVPADSLTPITEYRQSQADVESLAEKPPSLASQLPIVVIIQYGIMALHSTTHDQIFMSYLVSYAFVVCRISWFAEIYSGIMKLGAWA